LNCIHCGSSKLRGSDQAQRLANIAATSAPNPVQGVLGLGIRSNVESDRVANNQKAKRERIKGMMFANVNEERIVLRFNFADNFPPHQWEMLLDQLRSRHIPGLYQLGKRMAVAQGPDGRTESTIYFTAETVSFDEAVHILRHHGAEVQDARPGFK
jgi:hypothetical protein